MSATLFLVESNTTGTGRLFVERARDAGVRPVLLTRDAGKYADIDVDRIVCDTDDADAMASVVTSHEAERKGVWSSSDRSIVAAAQLAEQLGLPGAPAASVELCRNKLSCRIALALAGDTQPQFAALPDGEAASAFVRRFGAAVIKPCDGTGSINVRLTRTEAEARAAAAAILAEGATPLAETYLEGPEYSAETFNGRVLGLTAKRLGAPPHFIEIGHDFPADLGAAEAAAAAEAVEHALAVIGLEHGPAHVEFRRTPRGPAIIEINPRLAGGMIPEMIRAAWGIDLIRETIALAMGESVDLIPRRGRHTALRFMLRADGRDIEGIDGLQADRIARNIEDAGVFSGSFGARPLVGDFRDRLAYVLASGEDAEEAKRTAELAVTRLVARTFAAAKTGGSHG